MPGNITNGGARARSALTASPHSNLCGQGTARVTGRTAAGAGQGLGGQAGSAVHMGCATASPAPACWPRHSRATATPQPRRGTAPRQLCSHPRGQSLASGDRRRNSLRADQPSWLGVLTAGQARTCSTAGPHTAASPTDRRAQGNTFFSFLACSLTQGNRTKGREKRTGGRKTAWSASARRKPRAGGQGAGARPPLGAESVKPATGCCPGGLAPAPGTRASVRAHTRTHTPCLSDSWDFKAEVNR